MVGALDQSAARERSGSYLGSYARRSGPGWRAEAALEDAEKRGGGTAGASRPRQPTRAFRPVANRERTTHAPNATRPKTSHSYILLSRLRMISSTVVTTSFAFGDADVELVFLPQRTPHCRMEAREGGTDGKGAGSGWQTTTGPLSSGAGSVSVVARR